MKRSRKQQRREALTAEQVRQRNAIKATAAVREMCLQRGGQVEWQRYLDECRRQRNLRVRAHTEAVVAARRAAQQQPSLFEAA